MDKKTKDELIYWAFFILIFISITSLTYAGIKFLSLNYKIRFCLEEFEEQYSLQQAIYEYDLSCKDIFSNEKNIKYCTSKKDIEFCYYSFTRFIEDFEKKEDLCSKIENPELKKYC